MEWNSRRNKTREWNGTNTESIEKRLHIDPQTPTSWSSSNKPNYHLLFLPMTPQTVSPPSPSQACNTPPPNPSSLPHIWPPPWGDSAKTPGLSNILPLTTATLCRRCGAPRLQQRWPQRRWCPRLPWRSGEDACCIHGVLCRQQILQEGWCWFWFCYCQGEWECREEGLDSSGEFPTMRLLPWGRENVDNNAWGVSLSMMVMQL